MSVWIVEWTDNGKLVKKTFRGKHAQFNAGTFYRYVIKYYDGKKKVCAIELVDGKEHQRITHGGKK